jgi:hypothetical protein
MQNNEIYFSYQINKAFVVWFGFGFSRQSLAMVFQAVLQLGILLPQPPECWDYSCVPLYLAQTFPS